MEYEGLVAKIVKFTKIRYEDYVRYKESEGEVAESFDEVAEELLNDELDDSLIYNADQWTIIQHTCDDCSDLFFNGTAVFNGYEAAYDAFRADCVEKLNIY